MTWTRRSLLAGTAACIACPRPPPGPPTILGGPSLLGWRLVPGAALSYRVRIRRTGAHATASRAEAWTYRVVSVDEHDVATLEARQTATSGPGDPPVQLVLHADGRLDRCSARTFDRDIVHRGLALPLPRVPVAAGSAWPDPYVVRPFLDLAPAGGGEVLRSEARLIDVSRIADEVTARIATEAAVAVGGQPRITIVGHARWDAVRGNLAGRELEARFHGADGDDLLHLSWERA